MCSEEVKFLRIHAIDQIRGRVVYLHSFFTSTPDVALCPADLSLENIPSTQTHAGRFG
jgi:hypothetical protein